MKKIANLSLTTLRTEESFGFLKIVKEETALLTDETVKPTVDAFAAAYTAFDEALKESAASPSAAQVVAGDTARDSAWRGANAFVKVVAQYHPDAAIRVQAQDVKAVFDKYGDPTSLPQTEESGVLHNLLQDLAAVAEAKITAIGLKPWTDQLNATETAYLAAVKQRTDEDAQRVTGIVKQTRTAAEMAYRQLTDVVNALFVLQPATAAYGTFIDHLNTLVDRQKTVLKARSTANAKKAAAEKPAPQA